jgi:hypothetical protein
MNARGIGRSGSIIGLCILLSGCASVEALQGDVRAFVGHDVHGLIPYIGYPDALRDVGDETVYVWSTNRISHLYLPATRGDTVSIGGDSMLTSKTTTEDTPRTLKCAIVVVTDAADIVKRFQVIGDEGGCARYAGQFRRQKLGAFSFKMGRLRQPLSPLDS